jgi:DNA polymerase I-like protein with 3'-5' exonuclease and polymerase domains
MERFAREAMKYGFSKDDFVFASAVRCPFRTDDYTAKQRNQIVKPCREYLLRVIERMRPDIIIGLGGLPARQIDNRAVKIMKRRGLPRWSEEHETWAYHMLDPAFVNLYPQHSATFTVDFKTLRRFIDSGFDLERMGENEHDYQAVDDLQFLIDRRDPVLSLDVETQGLRPKARSCKLLSIQISTRPGEGFLIWWDKTGHKADRAQKRKIRQQMRELLCREDVSIVGQNLKYDAGWILEELGIRFRLDHDTLMMTALLDENSNDKGLDHQVKLHVPEMAGYNDHFNQTYDKTNMDAVPTEDFVPYGCGDTDAALRLYYALRPKLEMEAGLWNHYRNVSMPGLNAFVGIEGRGMSLDRAALDTFAEVLTQEVDELRGKLIDQVPRSLKRKHAAKGISFSRGDFVKDVLFSDKGLGLEPIVFTKTTARLAPELRQPSTSSKDHLPYFFEDTRPIHQFLPATQREAVPDNATVGQFVMDLAEYQKTSRLLSTNVLRFRENYMVGDKIYPVYSLWTTVTGRTSSQDPNGQNFPKRGKAAKAYRRIFVPPPGFVQLEADLSQAELRIAGDMARDAEMIRIYNEVGGDIHTETACIVMGVSMAQFRRLSRDEQALARFKAKAVNFGFLYGMGWRKFIVYAKTQYGVEFTEAEAVRIREAWFNKYSALGPWHRSVRHHINVNKEIPSYSGRVRHLPMIDSTEESVRRETERQGINAPVQEFASSLGVMAMGRMDLEVDDRFLALTGFVHDALYAYCAPEHVEWGAKTLKRYMETNPISTTFGVMMRVPMVADVSFGWNGAEMYEMGQIDLDSPYDFEALEAKYSDDENPLEFGLPVQQVPANNGLRVIPDHLRLAA